MIGRILTLVFFLFIFVSSLNSWRKSRNWVHGFRVFLFGAIICVSVVMCMQAYLMHSRFENLSVTEVQSIDVRGEHFTDPSQLAQLVSALNRADYGSIGRRARAKPLPALTIVTRDGTTTKYNCAQLPSGELRIGSDLSTLTFSLPPLHPVAAELPEDADVQPYPNAR